MIGGIDEFVSSVMSGSRSGLWRALLEHRKRKALGAKIARSLNSSHGDPIMVRVVQTSFNVFVVLDRKNVSLCRLVSLEPS